MRIMCIGADQQTIYNQWIESGCGTRHEYVPFIISGDVQDCLNKIANLDPDVIVISFSTGNLSVNGAEIARLLQENNCRAELVENTSSSQNFRAYDVDVVYNAIESPEELAKIISQIARTTPSH